VRLDPAPHRSEEAKASKQPHRVVLDQIAKLTEVGPNRLIGFAWIEPTLPDALEAVDHTFGEKRLRGVKMITNKWHPADEQAQACYAKISEYGKPMLRHHKWRAADLCGRAQESAGLPGGSAPALRQRQPFARWRRLLGRAPERGRGNAAGGRGLRSDDRTRLQHKCTGVVGNRMAIVFEWPDRSWETTSHRDCRSAVRLPPRRAICWGNA